MSYALQVVAAQMRPELERYQIKVDAIANIVIANNLAMKLNPYGTTAEYKHELNFIIKAAKAAHQRKLDSKQEKLL